MTYDISAITELTPRQKILGSDAFVLAAGTGAFYATYQTTYGQLSAKIYDDATAKLAGYKIIHSLTDLQNEPCPDQTLVTGKVILELKNYVDSKVINAAYPVGAIFITVNKEDPNSKFPGTSWRKIAQDRCLWGAPKDDKLSSVVNSMLPAPEFSGTTDLSGAHAHTVTIRIGNSDSGSTPTGCDRCVEKNPGTPMSYFTTWASSHAHTFSGTITSDVYKMNQKTVQPPAFYVNMWQRVS